MLCKPILNQRLHSWRQLSGLTVLSLLFGLGGCVAKPATQAASPTASSVAENEQPLVVATNTVVCDLARQIAAETINLKCLIDAGSDPHEYKPKPEDSKAIEQANLILYGGYNFEPELIRLIKASSNPAPKIAVDEIAVPTPQTFDEDGKTEIDPHVFHSAANGVKLAAVINKTLMQLKPNQAALYAANTQKVTAELTRINTWIKTEIATIPVAQRKLVTTHDAFGYYSNAYGIPVIGALQGVSTDEKATPTRVKALVNEIKATGVPTIFAEATINPKLIEAVAKEADVKVAKQDLFADGLGEQGSAGDTYQTLLLANTKTIVEGLGGSYTPFQAK